MKYQTDISKRQLEDFGFSLNEPGVGGPYHHKKPHSPTLPTPPPPPPPAPATFSSKSLKIFIFSQFNYLILDWIIY